MNIFLVIEVLLLIFIILTILYQYREKERTIVIGKEEAREKQRIETKNYLSSSLPDFDYSKWIGEQSLINPKYNELDLRLTELCKNFKEYEEDERKEVRESINRHGIYTLLTYTKRVTIFGIRSNESSYIESGFTAIGMIELKRCDYRDILVALSFLNYGVQRLNLDSSKIFQELIRLSDDENRLLIQQFIDRPKEHRSIEIMGGYKAIDTVHGVSFVEINYKKYNPEKDLVKIMLDVSEYLYQDKYRRGRIKIGETITPIWLNAINNQEIISAISTMKGCVSLMTELKTEFHPNSSMQMLLIYLTEFSIKKVFKLLCNIQLLINPPILVGSL